MKFRIHFEIEGVEDYFDVEGPDIKYIKEQVEIEESIRGINSKDNNCWSEKLE